MAIYTRTSVLDGQMVELKAVFVDAAGNFIDPATLPQIYIYDESVDTDTIDEEIDDASFASALAGPLTPTQLATGFYELEYTVPAGSTAGIWHDVWISSIETTDSNAVLSFTVINGADVSVQRLLDNEIIVVELDSSISSYTGLSLAADIQLSFITSLKPYYASPDLVRMEIGPWIDFIPDATLAMMIHWSSKEADFIMTGPRSSAKRVQFARAKFVSYDAVLRALYLPGSSSYQPGGGSGVSKRLGDLAITNSAAGAVQRTASGIDVETLGYIKAQRDEWFRVVNAGGSITPGQSLGFETALRNRFDPDRRLGGRGFADPDCYNYEQPALNAKARFPGHNKGKFYFRPNWPGVYTSPRAMELN